MILRREDIFHESRLHLIWNREMHMLRGHDMTSVREGLSNVNVAEFENFGEIH